MSSMSLDIAPSFDTFSSVIDRDESRSVTPSLFDLPISPSSSGYSTPRTESSILFSDEEAGELVAEDETVLVIGGLGFIGSHTTWELLKEGHNVVIVDDLSNSYISVLDRLQYMTARHFSGSKRTPRIDFFECDFRDAKSMRDLLLQYQFSTPDGQATSRICGVIHFAAYKAVEESLIHPLKYYSNNVAGLIDFCALLDSFKIKTFIFSSSATVYGELANQGGRLKEELCVHETISWVDSENVQRTTMSGCTGLTNPYGRTKWMCEAILNDLAASDPAWRILALRYFNPVGADPDGLLGEDPRGCPSNLMPILVQAISGERECLSIFGSNWDTRDGTCVRDFIHVSDLARGHVDALHKASKSSAFEGFQAINLGTGNGCTVHEVVGAMEGVIGRKIATKLVERRNGDVGFCVADTEKAATLLGWRAQRTVDDSCRDLVRYLKLLD